MIHSGQALAYMKRLNQIQLNLINQKDLTSNNSKQSIKTTERNLAETDLNDIQKQKLSDLIQAFPDVFNEKTGQTSKVKHVIRLLPGSQPCNLPSYRIAPARRQIVEENLREMLQAPKKDGTLRLCIDYRKLNAMTICDAYPIPKIDDTLDSLQEATFISTLDLRTGMPYGLTNAPTTFQRLMDIVVAGLKWQCCLVYIDDVIIYSPTFEQHIEDLKRVFEALRSANLTLKTFKCHFCRRETKYLAYIITSDCVKPDPDLVKSVVNFPRPRTIRDVQSFLGLTGYYHRFIQNYARIAEPLIRQLRFTVTLTGYYHRFIQNYARIAEPLIRQLRFTVTGNHHLRSSNECTEAFNTLKKKLTTAPIMNTPNFEQPFILEVDAFEYGLGAILTQEYDDKKYVIAYASRTLSAIERRYGATEREALTIVWATKHFRVYIERSKTLIRSDSYQVENIQYRPGKQNANADSLSRNPVSEITDQHPKLFVIETVINLWENTNILDEIKTKQQTDPKLKYIIDRLRNNNIAIFNDKRNPYVSINDILYKVKNSNRHYNQREIGNKHLLVIPKSMQQKLLSWALDHSSAGHDGQQKTLFRLTTRVFRDSILNYLTRWIELFPLRTTPSIDITQILINELFTKTFKCHFCRRETKYLAYIITSDCVKPDPDLVKSVVNFPRSRTIRDVQSFLGLTGYYHRFIQNYARIAEPLIRQLRFTVTGNHHLRWSNECTEAFKTLKKKLTTAPIMNTPNFEQPFILEVDAFEYGLSAILTQEYDDKKYVIAYASRTLSAIERRYGAIEREALTIVWATKHFRVYIETSKILIRSDCKALQWLRNTKDVTGRLAR
ncbi:unnamed protein product [Rotaria sordida]|uniref:Reverse transcriptase domain-containing protein n=1 Tax=Rotaria sordida TaxID=392033 RepID=A0A815A7F6_9BILA|nr:unnamed protein product [Rotaria sordida]